jgi:hypothetical protein
MKPDEVIAEQLPNWLWKRHIYTDPIWMEYAIEQVDPELRTQLASIRLKTVAAVYGAISQGAASAAAAVAKQGE